MISPMYRQLETEQIVETIGELRDRIQERFPDRSLPKVAEEVHQVGLETVRQIAEIRRPNLPIRGGIVLLVGGLIGLLCLIFLRVQVRHETFSFLSNVMEVFEEALSSFFFLGAIILFLLNLEQRAKRRRALDALHELRSLAHIIDMHQLTKDPEHTRKHRLGPDTQSSPSRTLTTFELSRYLDYCSEMLSLIGKLSAVYVQGFKDPVVLAAVDALENLTTGCARKIWQKLMILDSMLGEEPQSDSGIRGGG